MGLYNNQYSSNMTVKPECMSITNTSGPKLNKRVLIGDSLYGRFSVLAK